MTLTDEHDGRRGRESLARIPWRVVACATAAILLSGCVQTSGTLTPPTVAATAPAGGDPLAPGATPASTTAAATPAPGGTTATASSASPAPPTAKAVAATPAPPQAAPAKTVSLPPKKPDPAVAAAKPAPPKAVASSGPAPVTPVATEPFPTAAPAAAAATTTASGATYPNINVPPAQPVGTLLPPDERKRIIAELEAMRAKQGGPAPAASPAAAKALTAEGATHGAAAIKKIEACSGDDAATNPDCQAPSE